MSQNNTSTEHTGSGFRFPNSRRIYVKGSVEDLRVPFREIDLSPSRGAHEHIEHNPAVRVYDSSGPWGDPDVECDVHDGLPAARRDWIISRGDETPASFAAA